MLLLVGATLALACRDGRALGLLLLPPAMLLLSAGMHCLLGGALGPAHLLLGLLVLGVGLDDALLLGTGLPRAQVLRPVLTTSASTLAGAVGLCLGGHPLLMSLGAALACGVLVMLGLALAVCRAPVAGRPAAPG